MPGMENIAGTAYAARMKVSECGTRVVLSVVMAVALAACAGGAPNFDYSKEPDPRKSEYVVGAADSLKITVWKNPELSTDVKVRPDGTITMPLIGDLLAVGRTPSQLTAEISRRLAAYVKDDSAIVTVAVVEVNSYRITVAGNVERPGIFPSKYFITAAEAVALAGGMNRFASTKRVVVVRTEPSGEVRKIPVNYDRIANGEHPEENVVMMSGDTLFVP
jgi:polysaccharide export outer membrane protein